MVERQDVTDSNFEEEVLKSDKPVIVDFWASWCRPCRMTAAVLDELAGEYGNKAAFVKLNTDDNTGTTTRYGIRSIPTIMVFRDGETIDQVIGFRRKLDLKKLIDKAFA